MPHHNYLFKHPPTEACPERSRTGQTVEWQLLQEIGTVSPENTDLSSGRKLPHHNRADTIRGTARYTRAKFKGGYNFKQITSLGAEHFGRYNGEQSLLNVNEP